MSSIENVDNVWNTVMRNLFWGVPIIKSWFRRKGNVSNTTQSWEAQNFQAAARAVFFACKISFAIGFFIISIPIGIIRMIVALMLIKKRTEAANANNEESSGNR